MPPTFTISDVGFYRLDRHGFDTQLIDKISATVNGVRIKGFRIYTSDRGKVRVSFPDAPAPRDERCRCGELCSVTDRHCKGCGRRLPPVDFSSRLDGTKQRRYVNVVQFPGVLRHVFEAALLRAWAEAKRNQECSPQTSTRS